MYVIKAVYADADSYFEMYVYGEYTNASGTEFYIVSNIKSPKFAKHIDAEYEPHLLRKCLVDDELYSLAYVTSDYFSRFR